MMSCRENNGPNHPWGMILPMPKSHLQQWYQRICETSSKAEMFPTKLTVLASSAPTRTAPIHWVRNPTSGTNKWWSCSSSKIQHCTFCKCTTTSSLKTELQISYPSNECHWSPLFAKYINDDTSWMGCHFWCISANFWICGMWHTLLKSSHQGALVEEIVGKFWASLSLQKCRCLWKMHLQT